MKQILIIIALVLSSCGIHQATGPHYSSRPQHKIWPKTPSRAEVYQRHMKCSMAFTGQEPYRRKINLHVW